MKLFSGSPKFGLLLVVVLCLSCTRDPQPQTTVVTDSSTTSETRQEPLSPEGLDIPAVPTVSGTDSLENGNPVRSLPESDSMDVKAKVTLKSIASSETVARGVQLFVLGVDRQDSLTILHLMLQNLWGSGTKIHPEPISVSIPPDNLRHAKLLDDQTGKVVMSNAELALGKANVTSVGIWKLKPGEAKSLTLAFGPLSRGSRTATLIIPEFATVTKIALNP